MLQALSLEFFVSEDTLCVNLGLRQSNFNGDPNVKHTCLPTGRMAQCRVQIEKCKIAFCQIGTLARLHDGTSLVRSA